MRDKPWMCLRCGYMMDATWAMKEGTVPKEDDLSLCMNCTSIYVRHGDEWHGITPTELARLTREEMLEIARVKLAISMGVDRDLSKKQGGKA